MKFTDLIERINSAKSADEAFKNFTKILQDWGYDRITYTLCTDHYSLGLPKQHGLATSYPDDWMQRYHEKDYINLDPVFKHTMKSRTPFFWDDLINDPTTSPQEKLFMQEAVEAKVRDGLAVPLIGKPDEIVGVGIASSMQTEKNHELMAKAFLLSTYFHETFRSYLQTIDLPVLTTQETDVLAWAAEGKTDEEIALLLGLSVPGVRYHWTKIFKKLDVYGRAYAVTKAIRYHLITPTSVAFCKKRA